MIAALVAEATAAWPELGLADAFAEHLAALPEPAALRAADYYLAWACGCGNARALAILEADHLAEVARRLRGGRLVGDEVDEVMQRVRERLLVGTADAPPKIVQYAGRGHLRGWLVVAATRLALNLRRERRPEEGDELAAGIASPDRDPELALVRESSRDVFRTAVASAIERLEPLERLVLKQHYIDGVGIGELAALHGVHRATSSRWLTEARDKLARLAREILEVEHGIAHDELASMVRLFDSGLEMTLRGLR